MDYVVLLQTRVYQTDKFNDSQTLPTLTLIYPIHPHVGMSIVVEADKRGRILIPSEIRRKFKTRRYKMTPKKDRLELEPLEDVDTLYLKFAQKISSDWETLEEKGEEFVSKGRR